MSTSTDCRTEEGIIVGLIDSLIMISRVLKQKLDQNHKEYEERIEDWSFSTDVSPALYSEPILDAFKDLQADEDLFFILNAGINNPRLMTEDNAKMMQNIGKAHELLKQKGIIL